MKNSGTAFCKSHKKTAIFAYRPANSLQKFPTAAGAA
jgi:hypothetical protein